MFTRRRRGSVSLEVVLIAPVVVALIFAGRYIGETMTQGSVLGAYVRTVAANKSFNDRCTAGREGFASRRGVRRDGAARCSSPDGENGLRQERPFFAALREAAQPMPEILADIDPRAPVRDVLVAGEGDIGLSGPPFVESFGPARFDDRRHRLPNGDVWTHAEEPWRSGYDPALWRALRRSGAWRLFPNVFPAAQ